MDIREIKENLNNSDKSVRRQACEEVQEIKDPDFIEHLLPLMEDSDAGVREACGEALKKIGGDKTIRSLFPYLESREECARNLACEILETIGSQSIEPIIELLNHPDRDVRKFVADVLGNIGDKKAVPALIESMKDSDPNVVTSVIESLGKLADERGMDVLLDALKGNFGFESATALGKISSPRALSPLFKLARNQYSFARYAAIESIGMIGSKDSIPELVNLLEEKDETLQKSVLKAIGKIDKGWLEKSIDKFKELWNIKALMEILDEEDEELRRFAIILLGTLNFSEGNKKLIEMLKSGDEDQVSFVIHSLVRIGKKSIDLLLESLKSENDFIRERCALILGDVQNRNAMAGLVNLAEDPNPVVRISAIRSIGKLSPDQAPEVLVRALHDEEELVRKSACDALGWMGSPPAPQVVEGLVKCLKDESKNVGESAIGALVMIGGDQIKKMILDIAADDHPRVKIYANYGLGSLGGSDAVSALKIGLDDEDWEVRKSAIEGLARTGEKKEVAESLKISFGDNDSRVRIAALQAIVKLFGEESFELLKNALKDTDPWVRFRAVKAMACLKNGEVADVLIQSFSEQDKMVQNAICELLGELREQKKKTIPFLEKIIGSLKREEDFSLKNTVQKSLEKLK